MGKSQDKAQRGAEVVNPAQMFAGNFQHHSLDSLTVEVFDMALDDPADVQHSYQVRRLSVQPRRQAVGQPVVELIFGTGRQLY